MQIILIFASFVSLLAICCSRLVNMVHTQTTQQAQGLLYCTFDVSRDGKKVVFSGVGNGDKDLYILNLSTGKVSRLTNTPDYENYPCFSPDGKSVLYQGAKGLNQPRYLFMRSLISGGVKQLTFNTNTSDSSPSFSWDGNQIVFCRSQNFVNNKRGENTWNDQDVYVMNKNGSNLRRITQDNSDATLQPKFYPDNKRVLFEREKNIYDDSQFHLPIDSQMHLERISLSGNKLSQEVVKFGTFADFDASFFPDGKEIVFCSNSGGTLDLYKVQLGAGRPTALIPARVGSGFCNPVVTYDGKSIYCLERYTPNLWKMNADGTDLHEVADSSLFSDPMHWKPKS